MASSSTPWLTGAEYPDIRRRLGLAGDDTTTLPDEEIENRLFLGYVARKVGPLLDQAGVDMDPATGDIDTIDWVLSALTFLTAARLAEWRMRQTVGEERASEGAGPYSVSYRQGVDWGAMFNDLLAEGVRCLAEAIGTTADEYLARGDDAEAWVALDGLSRHREDYPRTIDERLRAVEPEVLNTTRLPGVWPPWPLE